MTVQILIKSGWTTLENDRIVGFDFQGGTSTIEGEIDGKRQQFTLPRALIRRINN